MEKLNNLHFDCVDKEVILHKLLGRRRVMIGGDISKTDNHLVKHDNVSEGVENPSNLAISSSFNPSL